MIDIFDSKSRMRQGTYNLYLWQNRELDMSIDCTTPGLFYDKPEDIYSFGDDESAPIPGDPDKAEKSAENFVKINQLL